MFPALWKIFLAISLRWHRKTPVRFLIAFCALFVGALLGNIILDLNARTSTSFSSAMSAAMKSYGEELYFPRPISPKQLDLLWDLEEFLFFEFVPFHETRFYYNEKKFPITITFCLLENCEDSIYAPNSWKPFLPEGTIVSLYGKNFPIRFHNDPISIAKLDFAAFPNLEITGIFTYQPLSKSQKETLLNAYPGIRIVSNQDRVKDSDTITSAFRKNLFALAMISLLVAGYLVFASLSISLESRSSLVYSLLSLGTPAKSIAIALGLEGFFLGLSSGILAWVVGSLLANYGWFYLSSLLPEVFGVIPTHYETFFNGIIIVPISIVVALVASYLSYADKNFWDSFKSRTQEKLSPTKEPKFSTLISLILLCLFTYFLFEYQNPSYGYLAVFVLFYMQSKLAYYSIRMVRKFMPQSIEWKLVSRFLQSYASRFIAPISALSVAISLCISMTVLISSFRNTLTRWLDSHIQADSYFSIHETIPKDQIYGLLQKAEKEFPEQILTLYLDEQEVRSSSYVGIADIMAQDFHRLQSLNPPDILSGNLSGILASETAMLKWNLKLGDTIEFPNLKKTGKIQGFYRNYTSRRGGFLLNAQDPEWSEYKNTMKVAGIAIHLNQPPNDNKIRLENFLLEYQDLGIHKSSSELRESALQLFEQTFSITYILQGITFILASFSIAFAITALILARRKIFAIIASFLNHDDQPLRRIVSKEAWGVLLAATLQAIPSSAYLSWVLVEGINRFSFGWSLSWKIPWNYLMVIYLGSILSGIITAYLLGRKLPILNIWQYLKAKE